MSADRRALSQAHTLPISSIGPDRIVALEIQQTYREKLRVLIDPRDIPIGIVEDLIVAACYPSGTFDRQDALDRALLATIEWTKDKLPEGWER
jgi:hypothetical protein